MASKGKSQYALGTDGSDYGHRQRVVNSHSTSAEFKHYLRLSFYLHFFLYLLIVLKLSEDLLDRADIFILELQELRIPKPDWWEWAYGLSFLIATPLALRACRTNSSKSMYYYHILTWALSLVPILLAQLQYGPDFIKFVQEQDVSRLQYSWRGLPLSVLVQAFAIIALQVHLAQLWYSYKLYAIWSSYGQSTSTSTSSASSAKSTKKGQ